MQFITKFPETHSISLRNAMTHNRYSPGQSNVATHGGKQKLSSVNMSNASVFTQEAKLDALLLRPIKNSSLLLPCFVTNQH